MAARESEELLGQEELRYRRALLHKSASGCAHEGGREGRETGVCLCAWGSITQTNKQNYIQEGIFFLAEALLPSAL